MVLENWNIYLHQLVAETYQYHKKKKGLKWKVFAKQRSNFL